MESPARPGEGILLTDGESFSERLTGATAPAEILSPLSPHTNILPDCRMKNPKRVIRHFWFGWMVEVYCGNCGKPLPLLVPEKNCNFVFWLCDPCYETHGTIAGMYVEPDVVFWEKVKQAQLEEFGRELSGPEIVEALKDENHILAKLARDR